MRGRGKVLREWFCCHGFAAGGFQLDVRDNVYLAAREYVCTPMEND